MKYRLFVGAALGVMAAASLSFAQEPAKDAKPKWDVAAPPLQTRTVNINVALVKKLGAGFFGGEGFILEKLTGPGLVFIHGGGDFIEFNLKDGMTRIDSDVGGAIGLGAGFSFADGD